MRTRRRDRQTGFGGARGDRLHAAVRRRARLTESARRGPSDDAGVTLIELLVSMTIMTVVGAMVTGAVISMFRASSWTEAMAGPQSQLHATVQRLDREVRYASGVSVPLELSASDLLAAPQHEGLSVGDWYVEYLSTTYAGPAVCVELRLVGSQRQLQRRTWSQGQLPAGGWSVLANGVRSPRPFVRTAAGVSGSDYQLLSITLAADSPPVYGRTVVRETSVGFAALNTSVTTESDTICAEGRTAP
jgi:prepilin-type N-terminal cleavage/methylation domain-containing protein